MAPGTNIGSSTPVAVGGGEIPADLRRKVVNDAAAYARELAEIHGRNGDWAEQAVRRPPTSAPRRHSSRTSSTSSRPTCRRS